MKTLAIVLSLAIAVSAHLDLENFDTYQKHFGKVYKTRAEVTKRAEIFHAKVAEIKAHNEKYARKEVTWSMGINQFTDMTEEEFLEYANGLPPMTDDLKEKYPTDEEFVRNLNEKYSKVKAPESVDWRQKGGVTSVKNQGQCGSCTAFATTATMDTCFFLASGRLEDDLSEQYLVDCAYNHYWDQWGAFGCNGAWPQAYYDYFKTKSSGRHQTEAYYPYEGYDGACRAQEYGYYTSAKMTSWRNVWNANEETVKQWLAETGVVTTTIYASGQFGSYSGGVLEASDCCDQAYDSTCSNRNNHAVAVVGYGHDSRTGLNYWIVKNSWGTWWGDNGFIKIKRGTGHCGMFGHSASGPDSCSR